VHPVIATLVVAASAAAVRDGRADAPDAAVRAWVSARRDPQRDAFLRVATDLGSLPGAAVVSGLVALSGRPGLARRVAAASATAWTLAQVAKPLLPRERPYEANGAERLVNEPAGTSWPSGHAAVAAAMARTLGEGRGPLTRGALAAVASAVAVSRIYVGVHHASDVVAGYGLGSLSAALVRRVGRR
jgi:membrane-associated phospholipid phosphatase